MVSNPDIVRLRDLPRAVVSEGMRESSRVRGMRGSVCSMRRMADWRPLERVQAVFSPTAALRRGTKLMAAGKTGPAFQLYARAGRTGLAEAEYRVGRCYLDGVGVPPSRAEGIRWLERAARSRPRRSSIAARNHLPPWRGGRAGPKECRELVRRRRHCRPGLRHGDAAGAHGRGGGLGRSAGGVGIHPELRPPGHARPR